MQASRRGSPLEGRKRVAGVCEDPGAALWKRKEQLRWIDKQVFYCAG